MATEKSTKVELLVNDETKNEVEVSEIVSVEIRGATGTARYRLDPLQDTVIKLVVVGKVAEEDDAEAPLPVSTENVAAYLGKSDDVKNLKDREKKVQEDQEKAEKDAVKAAKDQGQKVEGETSEREHVGQATIKKEPEHAGTTRSK